MKIENESVESILKVGILMFDLSKITVLIVEDDEWEIKRITDDLITIGIPATNIKNTNDTHEALAMIHMEEPTLVFVDFHLSSHSGDDRCGNGDGAIMLKQLTEKYKNNTDYRPYSAAISSYMSLTTKKSIAPFSDVQFGKHQKNYPDLVFKRFLMSMDIPFEQPDSSVYETNYIKRLTSFIQAELEPFNFSILNPQQQLYITELICLIIPTLDKRKFSFASAYKQIAEKYKIKSSNTIKTIINRAFSDTLIKTDHFLTLYTGNAGASYPKPSEFYLHMASLVKERLSKMAI